MGQPPIEVKSLENGLTSMYLPKRELLSLRVVFALPKASMMGLLARICLSVSLKFSPSEAFPASVRRRVDEAGLEGSSTEAKYRRMNLADTVFPAPL
jgi:hypothetical protein